MIYILRPYQQKAVDAGIAFFKEKRKYNAIEILPTGSGKSLIIANIAKQLDGNTLVFQPTKEILEQNYNKYISYGLYASIYSASLNQKNISKVTFATIGSVKSDHGKFAGFDNIIIDECHRVSSKTGMYKDFLESNNSKVLGLTATPYRLGNDLIGGAMLKFLTRTNPRIFSEVIYYVQNSELFDNNFLCKLNYYNINAIDRNKLRLNSSGTDYTNESMQFHYSQINLPDRIVHYVNRILAQNRKILVFTAMIEEAQYVANNIKDAMIVTGETPLKERTQIFKDFLNGKIRCLTNVGVATTGVDIPDLDCILVARSTMSLALYYQMLGRGMRPHPNKKECWIVDMGDNISLFGKIENIKIDKDNKGLWIIKNNKKQLTNVYFNKQKYH